MSACRQLPTSGGARNWCKFLHEPRRREHADRSVPEGRRREMVADQKVAWHQGGTSRSRTKLRARRIAFRVTRLAYDEMLASSASLGLHKHCRLASLVALELGTELSGAAGAHHRAVRGWRAERCDRSSCHAEIDGESRQAVLCRKPGRRRRQSRHGQRGARLAGRLYDSVCDVELCRQSEQGNRVKMSVTKG